MMWSYDPYDTVTAKKFHSEPAPTPILPSKIGLAVLSDGCQVQFINNAEYPLNTPLIITTDRGYDLGYVYKKFHTEKNLETVNVEEVIRVATDYDIEELNKLNRLLRYDVHLIEDIFKRLKLHVMIDKLTMRLDNEKLTIFYTPKWGYKEISLKVAVPNIRAIWPCRIIFRLS